jgi:hypothetical protein
LPFKILGEFGEKHPFWLILPKKGEWIIALSTKRPILANHRFKVIVLSNQRIEEDKVNF